MKYENFSLNKTDDIFSVSKRKQLEHVMPESHFHSSYELYYLLTGERLFFIKERTIVIKSGDLIILNPNVLHRTANAGQNPEHEKIILNFKEEFLPSTNGKFFQNLHPRLQEDYLVVHFSLQQKIIIEELLLEVIEEAKQKNSTYEVFIQTLIMQILVLTSRYIKTNKIEPLTFLNPMHERISEVVRYINMNYKKDLSLQSVADIFFISTYYLSREFKEVTGFRFVEYVNSVRVKEAKKLLEDTNLKIYLISGRVGYGSITHFGRVFKEITGHAPLYYRKKK